MKNIQILKQFIKDTASQIKTVRFQYKEAQRAGLYEVYSRLLRQLNQLQYEYRHHHIAYCELRGKTRLQIEPKIREYHEPNERYIKQLKEKYAWTIEEIEAHKIRKEERHEALCAHS